MDEKFDKQKLLDLMRSEFAFIGRTLDIMSPEQMHIPNVQGPWSVKDTIAHLSAWHQRVLHWLEMARRGEGVEGEHPIELEPGYGWQAIDELNDQRYLVDKDQSLDDVLAEFQSSFEQIYLETEALMEDELFSKVGLSEFFRDPVWNYIAGNTFLHYREHIPPVRAWLNDISRRQTMEHGVVREE